MNNIMLDLETMGTSPNAAIIAIGAVRFNTEITDRFYCIVNLKSCTRIGLDIEPDTVMWWMKQSEEARKEFERESIDIIAALYSFSEWIGNDAMVWGNGASFDNVILSNAYKKACLIAPWEYRNNRCYRTLKKLYPGIEAPPREGIFHCAVDDASHQAQHLLAIDRFMKPF